MQASLASLDPRLLQSADQPAKWRRLLYTTYVDVNVPCCLADNATHSHLMCTACRCFLHCALRLRNRFGRAGWSVPYASSPTDLLSSVHYLREAARDMDTLGGVDWAALRFLVCEVGRWVSSACAMTVLTTWDRPWIRFSLAAVLQMIWTHGSFAPTATSGSSRA